MCARWLGHSALGDGRQASHDEMRFSDLQSLVTQRMGVMIESIAEMRREPLRPIRQVEVCR